MSDCPHHGHDGPPSGHPEHMPHTVPLARLDVGYDPEARMLTASLGLNEAALPKDPEQRSAAAATLRRRLAAILSDEQNVIDLTSYGTVVNGVFYAGEEGL